MNHAGADLQNPDTVKQFYTDYHDHIADKRYNSPYWIRRYVHRRIHYQFLPYLKPGMRVLDAGCGEGVLSCLMAQQGIEVVGADLSAPNIKAARNLAAEWGVRAQFMQVDAEVLPFADNSFDAVVSSHVLEHLPHLDRGLHEIHRVTKALALIAMPTCLTPACWVLLGRDNYWKIGRRTPIAMPIGLAKTIAAWLRGEEGPNEGYGGNSEVPHVWRFPWKMRRKIQEAEFHITHFEAGPLIIPYLAQYLPIFQKMQVALDCWNGKPVFSNFGYGSMAVCRKRM